MALSAPASIGARRALAFAGRATTGALKGALTRVAGLREKDVVLSVALALRDKLEAVPGFRAFMTRDADYFVPLHERVRKARRVQADLFVSIHADAAERVEARGASVFALSENGATSTTARWLARRENAADAVGGVDITARIRKDVQAMRAVLDMSTAAQIKDSLRLGSEVLGQLDRVGDLHKPQVEQAGFAVLKAPDIPSILVETAFISNPREEAKLRDPDYRDTWPVHCKVGTDGEPRLTYEQQCRAICGSLSSKVKKTYVDPMSPESRRNMPRTIECLCGSSTSGKRLF